MPTRNRRFVEGENRNTQTVERVLHIPGPVREVEVPVEVPVNVLVEVPGPERIVTVEVPVNVPGPETIVTANVPQPEKVLLVKVEMPIYETVTVPVEIRVPGPERVHEVIKETVKEVEVPVPIPADIVLCRKKICTNPVVIECHGWIARFLRWLMEKTKHTIII